MRRLGYTRYVAQGGDVGAGVTDAISRQAPEGLIGVHTNLLVPALGGVMPTDTDEERAAAAQIATFGRVRERLLRRDGYPPADCRLRTARLSRRPGRLDDRPRHRRLLQDRPRLRRRAGLGQPHPGPHPGQHHHVLADRHWRLCGPVVLGGVRAGRPGRGRQPLPPSTIPVGFTSFPGEIWRTPRSWVEASYPNVVYFNEAEKGGHFAAWEEPELFATEVRAAFRSAALRCNDPLDPGFGAATAWLNSEPLVPTSCAVASSLVHFWTFTCINWLRTLPYVRAWSEAYRDDGLLVVGVHTPEFPFEHDLDNVRAGDRGDADRLPGRGR